MICVFTLTNISASVGVCQLSGSRHLRHWADFLLRAYWCDLGLQDTTGQEEFRGVSAIQYLRVRQHWPHGCRCVNEVENTIKPAFFPPISTAYWTHRVFWKNTWIMGNNSWADQAVLHQTAISSKKSCFNPLKKIPHSWVVLVQSAKLG